MIFGFIQITIKEEWRTVDDIASEAIYLSGS